VGGCCECGDEPSGSCATELVSLARQTCGKFAAERAFFQALQQLTEILTSLEKRPLFHRRPRSQSNHGKHERRILTPQNVERLCR
jgi:hypothetical protein